MAEKASDSIPVAPGIKLEQLLNFEGKCIDPLTLAIITESLDYALETAARRLKAAGKIYDQLSSNPVLPIVKAIRNELQLAPQCTTEGPRVIQPSPPPQPKAPKEVKTTATAAEIKEVEALIASGGEGMTTELLEKIKNKPDLVALIQKTTLEQAEKLEQQAEKLLEVKKKERSLPRTWAEAGTPVVRFVGKGKEVALTGEYASPQALGEALGIKMRGTVDQVKSFERANFKVTTNGDAKPKKGETTTFVVERVGTTEDKWKVPSKKPEEPVEAKLLTGRWQEIKREMPTGEIKIVAYDWVDPKTDEIVPSKRIWIINPDTGKPTGNKPPELAIPNAGQILERMSQEEEPTAEELTELEEEEES